MKLARLSSFGIADGSKRVCVALLSILCVVLLASCGGREQEMEKLARSLDKATTGARWSEPAWMVNYKGEGVSLEDGGVLVIKTALCVDADGACKRKEDWESSTALLTLAGVDAGSIEVGKAEPGLLDVKGAKQPKGYRVTYECAADGCWTGGETAAPEFLCRNQSACKKAAKDLRRLVELAQNSGKSANAKDKGDASTAKRMKELVADIRKLTKGYVYANIEDELYDEEVTDIVFDPAAATLVFTTRDADLGDTVTASIPLRDVHVLIGGDPPSAVQLECRSGECISFELDDPVNKALRQKGADDADVEVSRGEAFAFGCEQSPCPKIADNLQELILLASGSVGEAGFYRLQAAMMAPMKGLETWVAGVEYEREKASLWLALADEEIVKIEDAWEHTIPLAKVRVTQREGGLAIICISEPCIVRYQGDGDFDGGKHGGDEIDATINEIALSCTPENCRTIKEELAALKVAAAPQENAPIPSSGNAMMDALNSLMKEITYTAEVTSNNSTAKGAMTMTIGYRTAPGATGAILVTTTGAYDIAWENGGHQVDSLGSTATVPLAEVGAALDRFERGKLEPVGASAYREPVYSIVIGCAGEAACIKTTSAEGGRTIKQYGVACRESICQAVLSNFRTLIDGAEPVLTPESLPQRATPNFQQSSKPAARPISRVLAKAVNQANSRVDRNAPPLPGLLPTQGLAILGDGRIALHTDSCASDRKGCGAGAITENEIVVAFSPAHINGSSVAMQGNAVIFACRPDAGACIRSPDGRLQFAGYGIPCRDQTECNRLVLDFSSLIAVAAQ